LVVTDYDQPFSPMQAKCLTGKGIRETETGAIREGEKMSAA
jgi:hypothetical protein